MAAKLPQSTKLPALLVSVLFALAGCMFVRHPGNVPDIGLDKVGALDGKYSVALINAQPDSNLQQKEYLAAILGYAYVNYNEWTEFFVNYYSNELKKRGVNVTSDSPNKILVKLDGFTNILESFKKKTIIHFRFSTADGKIIKEMYETDTSGLDPGHAYAGVIYHTVEKLLNDSDVLDRMKAY
ncbi:MAG: hypothetical protein HY884_06075 [Deltaproteobacteria bacterium]|nr:hypothetical protein [Deltaproteobacteria bacterium]